VLFNDIAAHPEGLGVVHNFWVRLQVDS